MTNDTDVAYQTGRWVGEISVWVALLAGAWKCWSISRRPATNTKCALSLMLLLLSFVYSGGTRELMKQFTPSLALAMAGGLTGLGMLAIIVTAIVLAIVGLVEFSTNPGKYNQGRAQAIWTLCLAAALIFFAIVTVINRASGPGSFGPGRGQPGKIITFDEYYFRFRSPDRPWVPLDTSRFNKVSKVAFTRRFPEAYFMIIPEKIGTGMDVDTARLVQVCEANMQAVASSCHVISETPRQVNGLNGVLVEMDAQVSGHQFHYHNWYCLTNGYAYQLVGYSSSADQTTVAPDLEIMLSRFELIDPNRMAGFNGQNATNFYSPRYGYTVKMTNSLLHESPILKKDFSRAEFSASMGDSCLVVLPIDTDGVNPDADAVKAAFLGSMGIVYPNEDITARKPVTQGVLTGEQFDFSREIDGQLFRYRFKFLQGNDRAYMIASWTQRAGTRRMRSLNNCCHGCNSLHYHRRVRQTTFHPMTGTSRPGLMY